MNKVTLIGNVVQDLDLKTYNNDERIGYYVRFTLAINNYNSKKDDRTTDFIDVVAFDKKAQTLAQYIHKGRQLAVEGKLSVSSYDDKDGNRRKRMEVILSDFTFINSKKVANGDLNITTSDVPF